MSLAVDFNVDLAFTMLSQEQWYNIKNVCFKINAQTLSQIYCDSYFHESTTFFAKVKLTVCSERANLYLLNIKRTLTDTVVVHDQEGNLCLVRIIKISYAYIWFLILLSLFAFKKAYRKLSLRKTGKGGTVGTCSTSPMETVNKSY